MSIVLSRAEAKDAAKLTEVAFTAKRHWGYPESWMARWSSALAISPDFLSKHPTFVAKENQEIVGFATVRVEGSEGWIDHLWVKPEAMRRGIGRALFTECESHARAVGLLRLKMEADPHAEAFYARMGARVFQQVPASMDGAPRFLPLMEKSLGL